MDRNRAALYKALLALVALRKESVDRNSLNINGPLKAGRRSPQGERG